jgi:serine/threonine protein kinase
LERTVAIKVLNAQLVGSTELRARFEREARIISQLQHPHICVLHDVGNEGPIDYLVMEFLQGESLAERLRKGPLASEEVLRIAIEIADALEKAHRAGVVHRGLKPGNVMLTKSGAKLLDFGLAKPLGATVASGTGGSSSASVFAAALTQTMPSPSPATPLSTAGAVIGTVQYMSPEQIQGIEADARSDIFAFGVMLFEMVTGKRTFEGKTQASIVGQILAVDPPSVSTLRPQTPGLDRVIRLCLDKDPDERIQTAHDLKLQLQAVAETPLTATQSPTVAPARRSWLLCPRSTQRRLPIAGPISFPMATTFSTSPTAGPAQRAASIWLRSIRRNASCYCTTIPTPSMQPRDSSCSCATAR